MLSLPVMVGAFLLVVLAGRGRVGLAAALAVLAGLLLLRRAEGFEDGIRVAGSRRIPGTKGVFATKDFAPGEVVERCPVLRLPERVIHDNQLNDYVFELEEGTVGVALGYGSMYNHSKQPHVEYQFMEETDEMWFVARRHIRRGEEVYTSYGNKWWRERGLDPV